MTAAIRTAVVGLGFMGGRWARALAEHPGAELALVVDVDEARAKGVGEDLSVPWSADPGDAVGHDLQGVAICTPEHLHAGAALAAIDAGIAVAIEKPLAHDLATADRIVGAAARGRVPVLAGHILRFEPRYAALHRSIVEGRIGDVQAIRSDRIGVLGDQAVLGGRTTLPLYYGVHEMDLARWYAGDIRRVSAFRSGGVLRAAGYDVDDLYSVAIEFEGGAHGTQMLGWSLPDATAATSGLSGFTVIGEHGYLRVEQGATGLAAYDANGPIAVDSWYAPEVHGRLRGALSIEVDHFVEVARGEADPVCTASDGAEALRASLAVELAATEGRLVDLSELAT